jgi:predicted nuclease with TOPRIM domain
VSFDKGNLDSGLQKCQTTDAGNQICLSSIDATSSVSKAPFKSGFNLKDGHHGKLFKSPLVPPYVSFLVATKHKTAQHLFKTRFQLSFSTILTIDGRNAMRPLLIGRSPNSDMVLDYQTISARHASIRFKNGDFYFLDECSSNGSYLHLQRPVELSSFQPVQFRLRQSIMSLKIVDKWNKHYRADCHTGSTLDCEVDSDRSIGSSDNDIHKADKSGCKRESIMQSSPPAGYLDQNSRQHLDLLYALAYPDQGKENAIEELEGEDSKVDHKISEFEGEDSNVDHKINEFEGGASKVENKIEDLVGEDSNVDLKIEELEGEDSNVENKIEDLVGEDSNVDCKIEDLVGEDSNVDCKIEDLEHEDCRVDHEEHEGEDSKVDHELEKLESKDCRVDEFDFVATSVIAHDDLGRENYSWVYLKMN